jgi:hypothetical protein
MRRDSRRRLCAHTWLITLVILGLVQEPRAARTVWNDELGTVACQAGNTYVFTIGLNDRTNIQFQFGLK